MSGKGSGRRPQQVDDQTVARNWARIFGKKAQPITVTVPANLPNDSWGVAERSKAADSTSDGSARADSPFPNVGSNPTAPAIRSCSSEAEQRVVNPSVGGSIPSGNATYVDDATGAEVS